MTILTDEINRKAVEAWEKDRPHPKTDAFDQLVKELDGDELMARMMWVFWQSGSLSYLDWPKPEFNRHLRWWKFKQEKNTIRTLIKTPKGKMWVWQMLHDAGAWL
jgi:hypothetical protein